MKELKNKIEHNEGILREIRNRIMKEIWSIIPTSLIAWLDFLNHWLLRIYTSRLICMVVSSVAKKVTVRTIIYTQTCLVTSRYMHM